MTRQCALILAVGRSLFLNMAMNTMRNGHARVYRSETNMIGVTSSNTILAKIRDVAQNMVVRTIANHARVVLDIFGALSTS
jgi:hypothetical protein